MVAEQTGAVLEQRAGEVPSLRRIWLCADDYGVSPAVSGAIYDLIERDRLNATSVMVVAPSFSRADASSLSKLNADKKRAAIGLHVTLTGRFRPLTKSFKPSTDHLFPDLQYLLRSALLRQLDRDCIAAEIRAQLDAFASSFGRAPDFVDGHQHVHIFPQIRDVFVQEVKRAAPQAWVRQCGRAVSLARRIGDPKGLLLDLFSSTFRRRAREFNIVTNPAFAGTYSFVAGVDFAVNFPRFLQGIPDGGLIMCHPGKVDDELRRLDPLTDLREQEYAYFLGNEFPSALNAAGVMLA
ncbi:MAG TPA: ChbG/HpnK family deacetylase [Xanthobacteraceae bacterium]|nr:ChbG/HpnK family deacetylase [Xanthobacteraceae bacterium]